MAEIGVSENFTVVILGRRFGCPLLAGSGRSILSSDRPLSGGARKEKSARANRSGVVDQPGSGLSPAPPSSIQPQIRVLGFMLQCYPDTIQNQG